MENINREWKIFQNIICVMMGHLQLFLVVSYFITDAWQHPTNNVKIIGGHQIRIEQAPYMASLHIVNIGFLCGGSIVHEKFILTAAHCVFKGRTYRIQVGSTDVDKNGEWYDVDKILVHEKYRNATYKNDISLFKLKNPLNLGTKVATIGLPSEDLDIKKGTLLNTTGWGWTKPLGNPSKTLLQVLVPLVQRKKCNEIYSPMKFNITRKMLCAGVKGKDSCQGDSGGPLTLNNILAGVVSFGGVCGKNPGVYTKIAAYLSWITKTIQNNL